MRTVNQDTINLIKSFEGLYLDAYPDPGTKDDPIKKGEPWTIGWGTIKYPNGIKVKQGDKITEEQALEYLMFEINQKARLVEPMLKQSLNDNQFGALVSFAYNLGEGNLKVSTLLRRVNNNPNDPSIRAAFMMWIKANNKVLNGLVRRRAAEANLYFKPIE